MYHIICTIVLAYDFSGLDLILNCLHRARVKNSLLFLLFFFYLTCTYVVIKYKCIPIVLRVYN